MQVIDLTHLVTSSMPVFPGSRQVGIEVSSVIESNGYNELHLSLSSHTGTHIDCGYHLLSKGLDTETTLPDQFIGAGMVIDCRPVNRGGFITRAFLQSFQKPIEKASFVLLFTGWDKYWGSERYYHDFPCPDLDAASYLAGFPLKGVGIDAISFDRVDSCDLQAHNALLSKGILLIENLTNLKSLPAEAFTFCCFPLKLRKGDGSPVRAVGIMNNEQ